MIEALRHRAILDFGAVREPQDGQLLDVVAGIWAEVLGVDAVRPVDDFLLLGGHSLPAIQITSQVRELVGEDVPLELIFQKDSLRSYVEALAEFAD